VFQQFYLIPYLTVLENVMLNHGRVAEDTYNGKGTGERTTSIAT